MRLLKALGVGTGSSVGGSGERVVFRLLRQQGRGQLTIFDVGGNVGDFTGLALEELGKKVGQVFIFEPAPVNVAKLNSRFRDRPTITVVPKAVAEKAGPLVLHFDYEGSGMASLVDRDIRHLGRELAKSITVQTVVLADVCSAQGITHIDLLKIDVEGAEYEVLLGAGQLLKERRIGAVLFEFGGANIDSKRFLREFWYLFHAAGYSLYRINPAGVLIPIRVYTEDLEQFQCSNYLFTAEPVMS